MNIYWYQVAIVSSKFPMYACLLLIIINVGLKIGDGGMGFSVGFKVTEIYKIFKH